MQNKADKTKIVTIMSVPFLNETKQDLLNDYLIPRLHVEKPCFVVTANPDIVMRTKEDKAYKQAVAKADYVVPDGAGIVIASKLLNKPIHERIPGFEVMVDLLEYANEAGLSCYLLGSQEKINAKMAQVTASRYPGLTIAGRHHGYFDKKGSTKIAEEINELKPDLIFAALGSPRQEKWISEHIDGFYKGLFMGVGGSFDVMTGEVKRAPESWIKLNMEWLYRLLKQPFRWKRILKSLKFMFLVLLKKA